jgi:hypothetical protein
MKPKSIEGGGSWFIVGNFTRLAIAIVCSMLVALSQNAHAQAQPPVQGRTYPIYTYSPKTLLKNWALSRCLGRVATDVKSRADAYATASAYLEFGHQGMEEYDAISTLVEKYVSKPYGGSIESAFNTMKCIDLFHSKELDQFVNKVTRPKRK